MTTKSPLEIVRSRIPDIANGETVAEAVSRLVRERDEARAAEAEARRAVVNALAALGQAEDPVMVPGAPGWWWWRRKPGAHWEALQVSQPFEGASCGGGMLVWIDGHTVPLAEMHGEWRGRCWMVPGR